MNADSPYTKRLVERIRKVEERISRTDDGRLAESLLAHRLELLEQIETAREVTAHLEAIRRRKMLNVLGEVHIRHDQKLKPGLSTEAMRDWIRVRKGLRCQMEHQATELAAAS
jgi:hypothetical protein